MRIDLLSGVIAEKSDLLWRINTNGQGSIIGLIENKINAPAQRDQYRDYELCGERYIEKGYCQKYAVALISPKGYSDTEKYPVRIFYEDIVTWLKDRPDERSRYLAEIYEKAIKKLSDPVEFWNKYKENSNASDDKSVKMLREALLRFGYVEKLEGSLTIQVSKYEWQKQDNGGHTKRLRYRDLLRATKKIIA